jgi:hypothetical protein
VQRTNAVTWVSLEIGFVVVADLTESKVFAEKLYASPGVYLKVYDARGKWAGFSIMSLIT